MHETKGTQHKLDYSKVHETKCNRRVVVSFVYIAIRIKNK